MHYGRVKAFVYRILRNLSYHLKRVADRYFAQQPLIQHSSLINFHAVTILLLAFKARNRAHKEWSDRTAAGETNILTADAIFAIVGAAAATEAFINEFAENIGTYRQNAADWTPNTITPEICAAADAIFNCEFAHDSVNVKFLSASKALGARFDKGGSQFQAFDRLIGLRNAIMHVKPPRPAETHSGEKLTDELARQGIALSTGQFPGSWFDRLMMPAVGDWACTSAREIILAFLDRVPQTPNDPLQGVRRQFQNHQGFRRTDIY